MMSINQVMMELDKLFAQERMGEVPQFLETHIAQALEEGDKDAMLTLYNECIGFYRETGSYDKSIENCHKAIALMEEMGLSGTMPYATTLLNIANAHRAAGLLEESLAFYNQVRPIYLQKLKPDDLYFAGLYNNLSLLYQEMGDFGAAKEQLENALAIVSGKEDALFEVAVTQANLANTCIELGQDEEAKHRAGEAIRIFEEIGVDDAHYSAALSALGSLYYMDKDYTNALGVMEKSRNCVAKYLGTENIQYQRLSDNIEIIREKMSAEAAAAPEERPAGHFTGESKEDKVPDLDEEKETSPDSDEIDKILGIDIDNDGWASVIRAGKDGNDHRNENRVQAKTAIAGHEEEDMKKKELLSPADSVSRFDISQAFADIKAAAKEKLQKQYGDGEQADIPLHKNSEQAQDGGHGSDNLYDEDKAVDAMITEVMEEIAFEVEEDVAREEEAQTDEAAYDEEALYDDSADEEQSQYMTDEKMEAEEEEEFAKEEDAAEEELGAESDGVAEEHFAEEESDGAAEEHSAEEESDGVAKEHFAEADRTAQDDVDAVEEENAVKEEVHAGEEMITEDTMRENPAAELEDARQDGEPEESYGDLAPISKDNAQEEAALEETYEDFTPEITGLELCRRYYEAYGKPMIAEKFPEYEAKIAVGLVGKGSDCFGFDDIQSRDHDFGPRFILWVTREVYEQIGSALQEEYEKLPGEFMDVKRIETFHGRDRAGVMVIEDFYKNTLGCDLIGAIKSEEKGMLQIKSWLAVPDYALAAAVNGAVFRDDEGIFSSYRELLMQYYPKVVWYRKIAQTCALFSQNGQYNLPRMRNRGQLVAAELAKAECVRQAMKLYYLLNRKYAPHDKWLFKAMPDNPDMVIDAEEIQPQTADSQIGGGKNVMQLVWEISLMSVRKAQEKELTVAIESLAVIFANELERQNIVGNAQLYLDANTAELTAKSDALLTAFVASTPTITALSLTIAKAEFEAFDKVQNEGGRASCQNNWPTFKVMRMSQYMTWDEDMLLQYLYDFKTNYANGRNMVEEKYARMMASTAPEEYAQFADRLPEIAAEKQEIMEQIIDLQVKWMEEFAAQYPRLAGNARTIHTTEDLPYDTSYETYLRGELGTYSDKMIEMYGRYIVEHAKSGKNVAREIMANTIKFYGYDSFEEAESKEMPGQ